MAKSAKKSTRRPQKRNSNRATQRMILYLVFLLLLFFAASHLGIFGVSLYNLVRLLVGSTAYLILAAFLSYLLISVFKKQWLVGIKRVVIGLGLAYLGILLIFQANLTGRVTNNQTLPLLWNELVGGKITRFAGGGFLGWLFYGPFKMIFSGLGVTIISGILLLLALILIAPNLIKKWQTMTAEKFQSLKEERMLQREERKRIAQESQKRLEEELSGVDRNHPSGIGSEKEVEKEPETSSILQDLQPAITIPQSAPSTSSPLSGEEWRNTSTPPILFKEEESVADIFKESERGRVAAKLGSKIPSPSYQLPGSDLLEVIPIKDQSGEREIVKENIQILEDTFQSFGIQAGVESAVVGPSITKYEVKLATGTRVSRVANLSDDLALALAAKDVRVEAPIPGKSLVGIEIPNSQVATVGFKEMWESSRTNSGHLLEVPLGKSLDGSIRIFDLAKMPHLLVAGATGSGKSVAVNGIITSILMKASPSQVKLLMVDPKMVELSVYNDIPHLLIPVVTNPRKAARALQKVVDEMENRYQLFSGFGVRNIAGYNDRVEKLNLDSDMKYQSLPLIVVIVDELADLMMVASKEVEDAIIRLGQKARAAGIHMILATQRPSVDVISGLIKANVPSRIAFAVSSGIDSRTILDSNGAEKLLGRGDMLFKPIDENHPVRLQGAFLSDQDVEAVVDFIKDQARADYNEAFDPGDAEEDDSRHGGGANGNNSEDPLLDQAKHLVISSQKASTAQLQRSLKIGFNRASELMNELEMAGVVGPAKGTTPRQVLISLEALEIDES